MKAARLAGPFVLAALVVALAHAPPAVASLPFLGIFAGPLGLALLAAGAGACLSRRVEGGWRVPRVHPGALFALAFVVYAIVGLRWAAEVQPTGDEPEYLLIAQSLWREGDLDLRDNWEREDFLEYVAGMPRAPFGTWRADGRPFPLRSPGLPLLLAPVYAAGGRVACVLALALAAALLTLQVRALALRLTGDEDAALLAWAASAGPPVLFLSFLAYPEIPAALAVAVALRLLLHARPGPWHAAALALLGGALPWLHTRLIPAAAALLLCGLARFRGRALAVLAAGVVLAAGAVAAYNQAIFGDPSPLALYGGRLPKDARFAEPLRALGGLFLDRGFGLLVYAPLFVLGLTGLARLRRRGSSEWLPLLAVGGAILLPILNWRQWYGGFAPPARFLVPLVPVLCCGLALRVTEARFGLARWRLPLLLASLGLATVLLAQPEQMLLINVKDHPPRAFVGLAGENVAERYLPSFTSEEREDGPVAVIWVAAFGLLLLLDGLARRSSALDRAFAGLALPVALLLLVGWWVDYGPRF